MGRPRGKRETREGKAVLRPHGHGGSTFDVIGVGFDSIGAIHDANWRDNQCRIPDAHMHMERPDWLIVDCKVTVTIDGGAVLLARDKRDRWNAARAKAEA